jgi:hypothetical protein
MSFFNPPAANINLPSPSQFPTNLFNYDPSQIAPTQGSLLGGLQNLGNYNVGAGFLPQATNIAGGMINDPFAGMALGMSQGAANLGMGAAQNQYAAGGNIYQTAMDPQSLLYNRMFAQNTEQARANASAAGLGTTPLGASSVDWANQNFNINWQNAQLQREISGAQAASQLQGGAAPLYQQSGMYPWQTGQQIGQANLGTIGNLTNLGINAAQIPGQQIAGWQQSIPTMAGLQQQAYGQQQGNYMDAVALAQLQLQQNQQSWNQQQQMFSGLGKVLGGVGGFALGGMPGAAIGSNIFGGSSPTGTGWGSNPFAGLSSKPFGQP